MKFQITILDRIKSLFNFKRDEYNFIPTEIQLTGKIDSSNKNNISEITDSCKKRVTGFTEKEILNFIYNQNFEGIFHKELGFDYNNTIVLREQVEPLIVNKNSKPGDIDLIIFDPKQPQKSTALEVKCVKLTTEDEFVKFNKEKNLTKGITQVNQYLKIGFHKTYLLIILLDDAHLDKNKNIIFKESSLETSQKLLNESVLKNLNENIGLIYLGVCQMTENSIYHNTKIDVRKSKPAIAFTQAKKVTDFLATVVLKNKH